jgi:hypothetical protein
VAAVWPQARWRWWPIEYQALWSRCEDRRMDKNDTNVDQLLAHLSASFAVLAGIAVLIWILTAVVACIVAPDDRPWSFFWCTLLLLGPLGVALALIAPSRPTDDD